MAACQYPIKSLFNSLMLAGMVDSVRQKAHTVVDTPEKCLQYFPDLCIPTYVFTTLQFQFRSSQKIARLDYKPANSHSNTKSLLKWLPSGRDLTLIGSLLHISNCRGLTTGFIVSLSLCLFLALTHFLSSLFPLFFPLSPSLGRFAIKTAVTQSKTVKLKLPPSLGCLSALSWILLRPRCVEFIKENKRKQSNCRKKP